MRRRDLAKATAEDLVLHLQDLLGIKIIDGFAWGSLEGCRFEATNKRWSKDTSTSGVITRVEFDDEGQTVVFYDENDTELFSYGRFKRRKYSVSDGVMTISLNKTKTSHLPQELGPLPYTEWAKFRIFLRE